MKFHLGGQVSELRFWHLGSFPKGVNINPSEIIKSIAFLI